MPRILDHIDQLDELMRRKGYESHFASSFGFYDTLRDNLIKHAFQCYDEKRSIGPLNLETYSHWTDSHRPYVHVNFYTDYNERDGFRIMKMNLVYANSFGPIRDRELPVRENAEIPARDEVNLMIMGRRRGLKL